MLNGSNEPWCVLRVPPGDESFSYLSTENEICNTISMETFDESGQSMNINVASGTDFEQSVGAFGYYVTLSMMSEIGRYGRLDAH